ncbi:U3 small nucleolar RNA-associated protein 6-domain-containing protein [Spinellus fusiger]|nr:U3 small nucleolar RNA-associated protein 6-domain-containing protein [Spinellus fusiger]
MAERVQFNLERMVPGLLDLISKGIFTKEEVKKIVEKRKTFETRMARRIPQKIDFLRAIEYEMSLESLRKLRKSRIPNAATAKTTESDIAGSRRIFDLFKKATNKFKGDIRLWIQYIDYAKKENANNILSGVFAQAIQFHPAKATLWILAASWEYETNANIGAARVMMQRSLRMNPENPLLWHEYFRLELLYIEKIKIRRRVLGIDGDSLGKDNMDLDEKEETDETDSNMIRLPTITGEEVENWNEESSERKVVQALEASAAEALKEGANPILQGLLATIVYNNAIQAIPNDLSFRTGFITIYRQFTDVDQGCQHVMDTILRDMASSPPARAYLATQHLFEKKIDTSVQTEEPLTASYISVSDPEFVSAMRASVQAFEEAVKTLALPEMWEEYIHFLTIWQETIAEENLKLYLKKILQRTFKACQKNKKLSEKIYEAWIKFMQKEQDFVKAQDIAKEATKAFPSSTQLWKYRIELAPTVGGKDISQKTLYKQVIEQNPSSYMMWSSYNDWLRSQWTQKSLSSEQVDQLYDAAGMQVMLLLPSVTESTKDRNTIKDLILSSHVQWAFEAYAIQGARTTYKKIIKTMYPTFAFYKTCLAIEEEHSKLTNSVSGEAEYLYDMATRIETDKQDIYLAYIAYLRSQQLFDKANRVYWKAVKEVPDKEKFDVLCSV